MWRKRSCRKKLLPAAEKPKRIGVLAGASDTPMFLPDVQRSCLALIDTGSTSSLISYDVVKGLNWKRCSKSFSTVTVPLHIRHSVDLRIRINGFEIMHTFFIYNGRCIIGRDLLQKLPFFIDLENKCCLISRDRSSKFSDLSCCHGEINTIQNGELTQEEFFSKLDLSKSNLSTEYLNKLKDLLWRKRQAFSSFPGETGRIDIFHDINTGDATPIASRQYRVAYADQPIVKEKIDEMLQNSIIKPTASPWNSPFVLVDKPNGEKRFCIDFRKLNEKTLKDKHPLPLIDELLDNLSGSKLFSTLDITSAYWHIPLTESSKCKTAFSACGQQFQFEVMPFGLSNAGATFQRAVMKLFQDCNIVPYLDDIVLPSESSADHIQLLEKVFNKVIESGLKLNPLKCQFATDKIKYLGFEVSDGSVFPGPKGLEKIDQFPVPRTPKKLQEFLGMCQFYARFIPNYASLAAPLTDISCYSLPKFKRVWNETLESAFHRLRNNLLEANWLSLPDMNKEFMLDIDASGTAMGSVLYQPSVSDRPVSFASKKFTTTQKKYSTTDREFCALHWAIKKFEHYLYGQHFIVNTDHKPLLGLLKGKSNNKRQTRYQMYLQDFDFQLRHISGKNNVIADALSRSYQSDSEENETPDQESYDINAIGFTDIDWYKKQREDEDLLVTINKVEHSQPPPGFQFDSTNVLRYHGKIVIPESEIDEILKKHHNSGHFGIRAVRNSVLSSGLWCRRLNDRLRNISKSCSSCVAKSYGQYGGPWRTLPQAPEVEAFQFLSVDLVGPLPRQLDGSMYIVTMVDHCTRFLRAAPVSNIRASTVVDVLIKSWISIFGPPQVLHSDKGTQFESSLFSAMCDKFGIHKSSTSVYHPEGNAIIERIHRTLKDRLRTSKQQCWTAELPIAVYNINRTSNEGASPFEIVFGRNGNPILDWTPLPQRQCFDSTNGPQPGQHVSVKVRAPRPLDPKFSGNFVVLSRPSQFAVKLENGSIVSIRDVKLLG